MLDGSELEEPAGVQLGQLVDAALHAQVRGVEGPGGAMVVLGKGRVEGGAVEQEIELRLPGRASPTVREAIEDVFQDETVVDHEGRGDRAGRRGSEVAEEVNASPAGRVLSSAPYSPHRTYSPGRGVK